MKITTLHYVIQSFHCTQDLGMYHVIQWGYWPSSLRWPTFTCSL